MSEHANQPQTTVIGPDTHIKGEMTFEGSAKLLGNFEGKISAKGELLVADGASCKASVDAARVSIDGLVEGNVTARERVELSARAQMKGDLVTPKLLVAEGATFVGHVTVGPESANKFGKMGEMLPEIKQPINVHRPEYAKR